MANYKAKVEFITSTGVIPALALISSNEISKHFKDEDEIQSLVDNGYLEEIDVPEIEDDELIFSKMSLSELKEVDYKSLNRVPLVEYATVCGLKIGEETKKEIYALIETVDFEGA